MKKIVKERTLNELRQVKTYGYRPPSPTKEKVIKPTPKPTPKPTNIAPLG